MLISTTISIYPLKEKIVNKHKYKIWLVILDKFIKDKILSANVSEISSIDLIFID